jgi:hypothetical protein
LVRLLVDVTPFSALTQIVTGAAGIKIAQPAPNAPFQYFVLKSLRISGGNNSGSCLMYFIITQVSIDQSLIF